MKNIKCKPYPLLIVLITIIGVIATLYFEIPEIKNQKQERNMIENHLREMVLNLIEDVENTSNQSGEISKVFVEAKDLIDNNKYEDALNILEVVIEEYPNIKNSESYKQTKVKILVDEQKLQRLTENFEGINLMIGIGFWLVIFPMSSFVIPFVVLFAAFKTTEFVKWLFSPYE